MHHGAGSSGLSFATCAEEIRKILPKAGILSIDARDHGQTSTYTETGEGKVELDLSLETLNRDLVFIVRETQSKMGWESLPDIVLVGHSLGGAVITDVAKKGELGPKVLAYAVLDVVEGMPFLQKKSAAGSLVGRVSAHKFANCGYRFGNGRSPKHGKVSVYAAHSVSLPCLRD